MEKSPMRFYFNGNEMEEIILIDREEKYEDIITNNCLIIDTPKLKLNPFIGLIYTLGMASFALLSAHIIVQMISILPPPMPLFKPVLVAPILL